MFGSEVLRAPRIVVKKKMVILGWELVFCLGGADLSALNGVQGDGFHDGWHRRSSSSRTGGQDWTSTVNTEFDWLGVFFLAMTAIAHGLLDWFLFVRFWSLPRAQNHSKKKRRDKFESFWGVFLFEKQTEPKKTVLEAAQTKKRRYSNKETKWNKK